MDQTETKAPDTQALDPAAEAAMLGDKFLEETRGGAEEEAVEPAEPQPVEAGERTPDARAASDVGEAEDGDSDSDPDREFLEVIRGRSEQVERRREARKLDEIDQRARDAEAALKRAAEFESRLKSDPIGALRSLGYSEEDIARHLLGEKKPARSEAEERLERLERMLMEQQEREKEIAAKREQESKAAAESQTKRGFVTFVAQNLDKFKHIAAHYDDDPRELAEDAIRLASQYRERTGRDTNFETVARFIENDLQKRYARFHKQPEPAKGDPPKKERTLSAEDASARVTPRKSPKEMTEDEARHEAERLAGQLLRETKRRR
jgi:hypothetical protein